MARGDLATALTAALAAPITAVVEGYGSTCRVRRPAYARAADKTRTATWADATPARCAVVLQGISAQHAQRAYGADSVAEREGIALATAALAMDDVLVVEAGPFAGEQLRVEAFGADIPMGGVQMVALVRDTQDVGL